MPLLLAELGSPLELTISLMTEVMGVIGFSEAMPLEEGLSPLPSDLGRKADHEALRECCCSRLGSTEPGAEGSSSNSITVCVFSFIISSLTVFISIQCVCPGF